MRNKNNLGTKVISGTFWTMGMRWLSRLIGLASMAIVARQISPEDFGIIAVSTAVVGLMESFTDIGADIALIKHPKPQREHYDTTWTLSALVHIISAIFVLIVGHYSNALYHDDRYEDVLNVLALSIFLAGLGNVGMVNYRRDLKYHIDFKFNIAVQIIGVTTTLALAFALKSYWALAYGILARSIAKTLLSYIMHPYRPKVCFQALAEMFNFSFWIMLRSFAMFLTNKADRLILATYFAPSLLGLYAIAGELASMAVFELLYPLGRALLPALASKQNESGWLEKNIKKIFNITATLAVASGVGLASIAEPALALVYGQQYISATHILIILALYNAISGFNQPIGQFLLLMNKAREFALIYIIEGVVTLISVFYLSINAYSFEDILYWKVAISFIAFLRLFYLVKHAKSLKVGDIISAWSRPIISGIIMYYTLAHLKPYLNLFNPIIALADLILAGALTFSATLSLLWVIFNKPDGFETEVFYRINPKLILRKKS